MFGIRQSVSSIPTAKFVGAIGATLIAGSLSGCATLMQPFYAAHPTAALVEPELKSRSNVSDEGSAATTPVDSRWITHVYRGWAGPSDM
jgi:hypothetical protein